MKSNEGIQLHLFEVDQYEDTVDEGNIIFIAKTKSHVEFTSLPFHGNTDTTYCITELGGYGGTSKHKWLVLKIKDRQSSEPESGIFDSMTEAMKYVETLTGKIVKFRQGG